MTDHDEVDRFPHTLVAADGGTWTSVDLPADAVAAGVADPVVYHRAGDPYPRPWRTLAGVQADYGPARPVVPMPDGDLEALVAALTEAGVRAVGTLAAALYLVGRDGKVSLVAGRPGSWESDVVGTLALMGHGLPGNRVHPGALAIVRRIITRWVSDPAGYVEVAENLSFVMGAVVDARGGWAKVADLGARNLGYADGIRKFCTNMSKRHDATHRFGS